MSTLRDGNYWLEWLQEKAQLENLMKVVRYSIEQRFGALPDIEDHVASAFLAIVEGAERFNPTYERSDGSEVVADGLHNFIRFIVGKAIGEGCASARRGGRWDKEAVSFTDKVPNWLDGNDASELVESLGVSHLYAQADHEQAEDSVWVVNNGKAMTTDELIDSLVSVHHEIACRKANCTIDELPMLILTALSSVEEQAGMFPAWTEERKAPEPMVKSTLVCPECRSGNIAAVKSDDGSTHECKCGVRGIEHAFLGNDLENTMVIRRKNGKVLASLSVSGAELTLAVNNASKSGALWTPADTEVQPSLRVAREMPWDAERRRVNESYPETVTRSGLRAAKAMYERGQEDFDDELMAQGIAKVAQMLNVGVNWDMLALPAVKEEWDNRHEYTPIQIRRVLYGVSRDMDISYQTLAAAFNVQPDPDGLVDEKEVSRHPVSAWIDAVMKGDCGGRLSDGVKQLVLAGSTVQAARA